MADAYGTEGWKLKNSDWIFSEKELLHGGTDSNFERVNIAVSKDKIKELYNLMISDDECDY